MIEISAPDSAQTEIKEVASENNALDYWYSAKNKDGRRTGRILITLEHQQKLMDDLQKIMHKYENWRIVVIPAESTIPKQEETVDKDGAKNGKYSSQTISREALYNQMEKGARLDSNFILLTLLSAIVCSIGLIKDNVSVVIGAMVIAPLLGPNLALAFGTALGDSQLISKALKTNISGLTITLCIAIIIGLIFPVSVNSVELMSRTDVGYDSLALALAAGAAAVLSITTGLSGALVGVMVAVALMPPALAAGLFAGQNMMPQAYGAALLLGANIICVAIASQTVFLFKGIKPRTWYRQQKSKQSVKLNLILWSILLVAVIVLIYLKSN
jgi:uncharacterized hydrophobic protein (TIGR00341 family)